MRSVSDWKFSAPVEAVDLVRIMEEAEDSSLGVAKGAVRVTLPNKVLLLVDKSLTVGKFDVRRPDGYLTNLTRVTAGGSIVDLESPFSPAPPGAVAVFICRTKHSADELLGKVVDRVEVTVEVF